MSYTDKLDTRSWLHQSVDILDYLTEKQLVEMKDNNAAGTAELERKIDAISEAMCVVLKEF